MEAQEFIHRPRRGFPLRSINKAWMQVAAMNTNTILDHLSPTQIAIVAKMLEANGYEQESAEVLDYPNDLDIQRATFGKLTRENCGTFAEI